MLKILSDLLDMNLIIPYNKGYVIQIKGAQVGLISYSFVKAYSNSRETYKCKIINRYPTVDLKLINNQTHFVENLNGIL